MAEELEIYGFGSYFLGNPKYNDVDILIVPQRGSPESCRFAIQCKKFFLSNIIDADVSILSQHEEQQISFIEKSSARNLGKVDKSRKESDLDKILKKIHEPRIYEFSDKCN